MNILEARRRTLGADVYKKTVQGNPVSVKSLARMRPGLKVFGRSEQFTTTGAQLFDASQIQDGFVNGATSGEKVVASVNQTYPNAQYCEIVLPLDTTAISYNFEGVLTDVEGQSSSLRIRFTDGDDIVVMNTTQTQNQENVSLSNGVVKIYILALGGFSDDIANAGMLNVGSTALPWEPYTGGLPSPNPKYPQEITNAGDDGSIDVDVTGANLWNGGEFEVFVGGSITGYTEAPETLVNAIKALPNGKYSVSYTTDGSGTAGQRYGYIRFMEGDTAILPESKSFEMTDDLRSRMTKVVLYGYLGQTQTVKEFMLNAGSTHLPYEPYKQPQTLTVQTPNGLPGIPVTSGGNYTDENGQQWISDEVDFRRGKYVQRVNKEYLTGTPNFAETPDEPGRYLWIRAFKTHYKTAISVGISNFAKWTVWGLPHIAKGDVFCSNDTHLYYSPIDDDMTAEEVNAKFAEMIASDNPPYIIGQLATPIETDLSEEQMDAYANLHTNRPTTVVSATDGAGLELTYKTKKSLEVN